MRLVVIESPYAAPTWQGILENMRYARGCLLDCLKRGEAPIASHLLYPQVLVDEEPDQRRLGIDAGLEWARKAEAAVFYLDRGESGGMKAARAFFAEHGIPVESRYIEKKVAADVRCSYCNDAGRVAGLPCSACAKP